MFRPTSRWRPCVYKSRHRTEFLTELFPNHYLLHYKADPVELARLGLETNDFDWVKGIRRVDEARKSTPNTGGKDRFSSPGGTITGTRAGLISGRTVQITG
jgi:hypothetical protein